MRVSAIMRGLGAGLIVALSLAAVLGFMDYQGWVAGVLLAVWFWMAAGLTFLFAGLVAGHSGPRLGWLHGMLAAVALNLIGGVVADGVGQVDGHLWLDLGFAALIGLIGGVWGRTLNRW